MERVQRRRSTLETDWLRTYSCISLLILGAQFRLAACCGESPSLPPHLVIAL
jgi:hypothetical protein